MRAIACAPARRAACLALLSVPCVACRNETLATTRSVPSRYSEIIEFANHTPDSCWMGYTETVNGLVFGFK
jgi:hypothetical protein